MLGFLIFFLPFGIWAIVAALRVKEALPSRHWKAAEGKITKADFVQEPEPNPILRGMAGRNVSPGVVYQLWVTYSYEVEGATFESHRVSVHDPSYYRRSDELKKLRQTLAVGKTISVYYNPDNPSEAVLHKGPRESWYAQLCLALALPFILWFYVFNNEHLAYWADYFSYLR